MLNIIVKKHLIRQTLREKLHLCKTDTATFKTYNTKYGKICVYTLSTYGDMNKAEQRLREAVPYLLYSSSQKADENYIKKAIIETAVKTLKNNRGQTVYLTVKPSVDHIISLCGLSSELYIPYSLSQEEKSAILKDCGTLPIYSKFPVACDLIIDENLPLKINLPPNLKEICPKEFSEILFCSLIYKENGSFII